MKKKILLIDESLTVQKVVALTLDKSKYQLSFAKSRPEVMKLVLENPPDLILLSDQMSDMSVGNFPKEMETWLGGVREAAPVVLISSQDIKEQKHYASVLKKPFSPQSLQDVVQELLKNRFEEHDETLDEIEDERLHKIFNDTFADESTLVRETFRAEVEQEEPTLLNRVGKNKEDAKTSLWEVSSPSMIQNSAPNTSGAGELWHSESPRGTSPTLSEAEAKQYISAQNLDEVVDKLLTKLVPPIVEKLVNERLDKLLKEQEQFLDLKS